MKSGSRSNVLLVEILIAILFFMLSATVLVQVFGAARQLTARSGAETAALSEAQNVADALYASDDVSAALTEMGFYAYHGAWSRDDGDYTLYVEGGARETEAGELWEGTVRAFYKVRNPDAARQEDDELFALPCARYKGVR